MSAIAKRVEKLEDCSRPDEPFQILIKLWNSCDPVKGWQKCGISKLLVYWILDFKNEQELIDQIFRDFPHESTIVVAQV